MVFFFTVRFVRLLAFAHTIPSVLLVGQKLHNEIDPFITKFAIPYSRLCAELWFSPTFGPTECG
jgi:hypothetical protein